MKKELKKAPFLLAASLLGAAGCCVLDPKPSANRTENPHQFPFYTQKITVTFATAEDAENAVGTIAPLPYGKKAAFTTRWDDSNPAHLKQAEILAKNGMHGLFLLNNLNEETVEKYFLPAQNLGSVFGNHAAGHALAYHHTPNYLYEAIAIHQAAIESALDRPSVSFAFPCGLAGLKQLYPNAPQRISEIFRRAGILSYPERKTYMTELQMHPSAAFATNLFTANDRDPDPERFRSGFHQMQQAAQTDPDTPRLTFGIHTWQNAEGFRTLDTLYGEIANRPDLWYCTENQYAAYRYNFYHARVEKTAVNGTEATFAVHRCEPAFAGNPSDLFLNFSVPAVSAGNYTVTDGAVILPDDAAHQVPTTIDAIASGEISRVFPGLSVSLNPENNGTSFLIRVANNTTEPLENVTVSLLLSMDYTNGIHRQQIASIGAGNTWETTIAPGARSADPIFRRDRKTSRVQLDFTRKGRAARLHAIWKDPAYTPESENVFRDTARISGPFPVGTVDETFCEAASVPGVALPVRGSALNLQWHATKTEGGMPFTVIPFAHFLPGEEAQEAAYQEATQSCTNPATGQILLAVDFLSNGAIRLEQEHRLTKNKTFWIDGKQYDGTPESQIISLPPGKHRLLILASAMANWALDANRFGCGILDHATGKPLPCFRPQ